MEIVSIDVDHPDPKVIARAAEVILGGGTVIYPTDTCYGIGADATSELSRNKVRDLKGRPDYKLFSVIVRDREMLRHYAVVSEEGEAIIHRYLPGSFTFIFLTRKLDAWPYSSIGIRLPRHPVTQALAERLPVPFVSSSANLSGDPCAYAVDELESTLLNPEVMTIVPDLVLDGGRLPGNPPSTIVDLTASPPKIHRQGAARFIWPVEETDQP